MPTFHVSSRTWITRVLAGAALLAAATPPTFAESRSVSVQVSAVVPERLAMAVEPEPSEASASTAMAIQIDGNLSPPRRIIAQLPDVMRRLSSTVPSLERPLLSETSKVSYQFRAQPPEQASASRGTLLVTLTAP